MSYNFKNNTHVRVKYNVSGIFSIKNCKQWCVCVCVYVCLFCYNYNIIFFQLINLINKYIKCMYCKMLMVLIIKIKEQSILL